MRCRYPQNMFHVAATCIPWSNSSGSIRQRNLFAWTFTEVNNNFRFSIKSMHMAGLMVFRISHEPNAIEP
jgi:hypothetical protein